MTERWQKSIRHNGDTATKAIDLLADEIDLSRNQLKQIMQNGAVWYEGPHGVQRIRRASKKLNPGSILHIYYDAKIQSQTVADVQLVADEGEYSVWNKPAGMFSQGSKWGDHCAIYRYAETHLKPERPAFIVHRLDRATRGLILLAHSKTAAQLLTTMFSERKVSKNYRALVHADADSLQLPYEINTPLDNKPAHTIILEAHSHSKGGSDLLLDIKTGRKHQIRRHLSEIGLPVVGDHLYSNEINERDLQLTSVLLKFVSPFDGQHKTYSLNSIGWG